jgi:AcrR family transcriptional regulator
MSIENEKYDIRQRIIDSAKERIIKYGYRNLRIDDITNDLQISKRTLYEIFSSKEDLVRELFQQSHAILANEIESVLSIIINNEEADFLFELRKLWSIVKNHTDTVSNQLFAEIKTVFPDLSCRRQDFEESIKNNFDEIYKIGIAKGLIKSSIKSELFFLIQYHALSSILKPEVISQIPLSINEVLDGMSNLLLTGALTEDAQKKYLELTEIQI